MSEDIKVTTTKNSKEVKEEKGLSKKELRELQANIESHIQEAIEVFSLTASRTLNNTLKTIEAKVVELVNSHGKRIDDLENRMTAIEKYIKTKRSIEYLPLKVKFWFIKNRNFMPFAYLSAIVVFLYLYFLTDIL